MGSWSRLVQSTLDHLLPPSCVSCGKRGSSFCHQCRERIIPVQGPLCWRCGRPMKLAYPLLPANSPPLCPDCAAGTSLPGLTQLRAVAYHEGTLRDAIHALKYQGRRRVARPLGDLLAHHLQKWADRVDVVVPVPLHDERQRQRGFNQAELLARRCADQLGVPCLPRALVRLRPTRPQVGLTAPERRANVSQAFVPGRQATASRLAGKRIVLVDDVTTTGSTLSAAGAVLASLHPEAVFGVALARPVPTWLPSTHVMWPEVQE